MPNPKVGTVTDRVGKAIEEAKAGKVEYRTDRTAIVHLVIGKALLRGPRSCSRTTRRDRGVVRAKPSAAKGRYLRAITMASTMGPGVKVDPGRVSAIS